MIVNYLHKFGDAFETQHLKLEAMKLETFPTDTFKFVSAFKPLEVRPLTSLSLAHNKIPTVCASSFVLVCTHDCK